ncbi:hypothetical protein BPTFM16_01933 [Altererythrobacter insulae]|nr:hypothetical protein BPTFM16_01933 [Altererythrobacter insulae]
MRFALTLALALFLTACGPSTPEGPVNVAIIGDPDGLTSGGMRLSSAGQHFRAATAEGLVAIDEAGNVIPALAERWIITDDGLSYIFRLRNSDWPDGRAISADDVRTALRRNLRDLRGTSLGLDLSKVDEIRDMTGRVVEITLTSPQPDFLRLLAQPEMGITENRLGSGPMVIASDGDEQPIVLDPMLPEQRGFPAREAWQERSRQVAVRAMPAEGAVAAFADGGIDLVLNGRLSNLPLADTGPLTRGTVRLDAALGLFGLKVRSGEGFLADPQRRQVIGLAIDRNDLLQPFNVGGWQSSTWIIPAELAEGEAALGPRWDTVSLDERRAIASQRVATWERAEDTELVLRIGLPRGPGSDTLFEQLAGDLAEVGITAVRANLGEAAELELHDRVARFYSPRWFLNQFNCRLNLGLCSEEADDLVSQSIIETDPTTKAQLLAAAHQQMIESEIYIPLGAPVRWSLVRGDITGFQENAWGLHPLFPLSQPPT